MQQSYKLYIAMCLFICLSVQAWSQTAKSYAVMVQRVGSGAPVKIVWDYDNSATGYVVYRKLPADVAWGSPLVTLGAGDTVYTDNVTNGAYEYYVQRNLPNNKLGHGYLLTHVNVAPLQTKGRLLLTIDAHYKTPLANEISQLTVDLVADGWWVDTMVVQRNALVTDVKQKILSWYYTNRNKAVKPQALYLLGRVPVPYSGLIFPDGHTPDHKGAWPADVYYGAVNEEMWTDLWVNKDSAAQNRNDNVPGDGKFDIDFLYPDSVALEIGRLDLTDMPAFGLSDTQLVKNYLQKAHAFKTHLFVPGRKAIVDDNFGVMGGEAFAASGWRSFSTMVGKDGVYAGDYFTDIKRESHVLSYGCGPGTYTSAGGVGNTNNFVSDSINTVFSFLFGSYFGDWDNTNNFLRAPLCSGPTALVSAWSGRPHWNLHHMAMGYTIGYSAKVNQNNIDGRLLTPASVSGYVSNAFPTYVHVALMGDPSLRFTYNAMPQIISALPNQDSTQYALTWMSCNNAIGYEIYGATLANEPGNLLYSTTDTTLAVSKLFAGINYLYVKAKYEEQTASGRYHQLSLGALSKVTGGVNATGVKAINKPIELILFPNPSQTWFVLNGTFTTGEVTVYDVTGKQVMQATVESGTPIQHNLPAGIYAIQLLSSKGIATTRLMVR